MRPVKSVFIFLASMSLLACGQYGGNQWPSLAFFDVPPEAEPLDESDRPVARPDSLSTAELEALGENFADILSRLEERKVNYLVAETQATSDGDDRSWLTAQLELTRLGRLESELSGLLLALPVPAKDASEAEVKLFDEISDARGLLRGELHQAGLRLGPRPGPADQGAPSP